MSDSPIFDMLDRERGFTKTNAEVAKKTQRYAHPLIERVVPAPVEEESEVLVKPFVTAEGEPRGLIASLFAKERPEPYWEQEDPAPYDPVKGMAPEGAPETFRGAMEALVAQSGIELSASAVEALTEAYKPVREETMFDPMEMDERRVRFIDFALETLDKFKLENPLVRNINFFIDTAANFEDPRETFVVTGRIPENTNPDEVMARPLKGVDLESTMPMFGVELIGAQDVPGDILAAYRQAVAEQHPGFVVGAVTSVQEHEDGSATLNVRG